MNTAKNKQNLTRNVLQIYPNTSGQASEVCNVQEIIRGVEV